MSASSKASLEIVSTMYVTKGSDIVEVVVEETKTTVTKTATATANTEETTTTLSPSTADIFSEETTVEPSTTVTTVTEWLSEATTAKISQSSSRSQTSPSSVTTSKMPEAMSTTTHIPSQHTHAPALDATHANSKSMLLTIGLAVPSFLAALGLAHWYWRKRRRAQVPAFEDARTRSKCRIDYNAEPLYPHRSIQRLSETSFSTTSPSGHDYMPVIEHDPPQLPPISLPGPGGAEHKELL
ncbi:hypothetical protein CLAFUR0_04356 [Fulvia fulva]|nr:hypothetical protein CLAFUR0_04356 [Fulvia fulva]